MPRLLWALLLVFIIIAAPSPAEGSKWHRRRGILGFLSNHFSGSLPKPGQPGTIGGLLNPGPVRVDIKASELRTAVQETQAVAEDLESAAGQPGLVKERRVRRSLQRCCRGCYLALKGALEKEPRHAFEILVRSMLRLRNAVHPFGGESSADLLAAVNAVLLQADRTTLIIDQALKRAGSDLRYAVHQGGADLGALADRGGGDALELAVLHVKQVAAAGGADAAFHVVDSAAEKLQASTRDQGNGVEYFANALGERLITVFDNTADVGVFALVVLLAVLLYHAAVHSMASHPHVWEFLPKAALTTLLFCVVYEPSPKYHRYSVLSHTLVAVSIVILLVSAAVWLSNLLGLAPIAPGGEPAESRAAPIVSVALTFVCLVALLHSVSCDADELRAEVELLRAQHRALHQRMRDDTTKLVARLDALEKQQSPGPTPSPPSPDLASLDKRVSTNEEGVKANKEAIARIPPPSPPPTIPDFATDIAANKLAIGVNHGAIEANKNAIAENDVRLGHLTTTVSKKTCYVGSHLLKNGKQVNWGHCDRGGYMRGGWQQREHSVSTNYGWHQSAHSWLCCT